MASLDETAAAQAKRPRVDESVRVGLSDGEGPAVVLEVAGL